MKLAIILAASMAATAAASAPFQAPASAPSYQTMKLTLKPGKNSGAITVPAANHPVRMMIAVSTAANGGVGEATIMRTNPASVLVWTGLDYATNTGSTSQVSAGAASNPGRHIIYADASGAVDIEVNNADSVKVHNSSSTVQTAILTFTW